MAELDWGSVKGPGSGENTTFLRLETGSNQIRIVGNPFQIDIHWEKGTDGSNKKVICPGAGCPICKAGHVPMTRFQVLAINRKTNKVEILEGGTQIFGAFKDFAMDSDYGDPTKYDFKIKKEGAGRETKYNVIASPNKTELTPEERSMVEASSKLTDINKPKSIEEIMSMGLEVLQASLSDLEEEWDNSSTNTASSNDGGLNISDDDWDGI